MDSSAEESTHSEERFYTRQELAVQSPAPPSPLREGVPPVADSETVATGSVEMEADGAPVAPLVVLAGEEGTSSTTGQVHSTPVRPTAVTTTPAPRRPASPAPIASGGEVAVLPRPPAHLPMPTSGAERE